MTWTRLDDGFHDHPRTERVLAHGQVGLAALGVLALCFSYCGRHLTDGHVPASVLLRFASPVPEAIDLLVDAGFLRREGSEGDALVVGYLDRNPSREAVLAKRERVSAARAEAGRKGGKRSAEVRRERAQAQATSKQSASRVAVANRSPDPTRPYSYPPNPPKGGIPAPPNGGRQRDLARFAEQVEQVAERLFPDAPRDRLGRSLAVTCVEQAIARGARDDAGVIAHARAWFPRLTPTADRT